MLEHTPRISIVSHTARALIFSTALACLALPVSAGAHGALAVAAPSDIEKEGFSWGSSLNQDTTEGAQLHALETCLTVKGNASTAVRGLCRVVEKFDHKCYAMGWDPKDGTPGVGWSIDNSKDDAERNAIQKCRATAGNERKEFCVISRSGCDESP